MSISQKNRPPATAAPSCPPRSAPVTGVPALLAHTGFRGRCSTYFVTLVFVTCGVIIFHMPATTPNPTYSSAELCTLTDVSLRTLRYYISIGLVDRPVGETRAAHYTQRHLEQLLRIRKLSDAGLSLERIRELLTTDGQEIPLRPPAPGTVSVRSHVLLAPGLELVLDPQAAGLSPEQARHLIGHLMEAAQTALSDAPRHHVTRP